MHAGGWAGIKPDEVPAILQRGERVLSRREAAGYGQTSAPAINVTIIFVSLFTLVDRTSTCIATLNLQSLETLRKCWLIDVAILESIVM